MVYLMVLDHETTETNNIVILMDYCTSLLGN